MISLDDTHLLFRGNIRNVYLHPMNADRCIKITHNLSRLRSVMRETRYLSKYQRQGKPFERLPRFHSWIDTSLGKGAIFDIVRDYDGSISKTLSFYIEQDFPDKFSPESISLELIAMRNHFLENNIIICDPAPHNIVVKYISKQTFSLVLVDGIGNPHFIKFGDILAHYSRKQILKKWSKYLENHPTIKKTLIAGGYFSLI